MSRFHVAAPLTVTLAILMAGCGQGAATLAPSPVAPEPAAPALIESVAEGRLEVRVSGLNYRVQATTDQVKFIRVTVSGGALSAPKSKEVVAGSSGTIALESIPAGTVNVAIEALDANGLRLGLKDTSATVAKGQTAVVSATLKLDATHVVSDNGNLEVDLKVENGEVIVDPVAAASPRPSSPVMSPVPSPVPTVEPGARLTAEPTYAWYADGTMAVEGAVKNHFATAKPLSLKIEFSTRGLLGWKIVETKTVALGTVAPLGTKAFSVRSEKKASSLLSNGKATITVIAE